MTTPVRLSMATMPRGRVFRRCFGSISEGWKRWRDIARRARTLHALPDAALRDIGVYRLEVDGVATFKRINDHS